MSASIVPHIPRAQAAIRAPGFALGIANRLTALAFALRQAWRRRRDRHALEAMGDRGLADLGIGPSEIEHAVLHGRGEGAARRREDRARATVETAGRFLR